MKITLANLSQATAQQVFDQVATHLLTQRRMSHNEYGNCMYRGLEGTMCAAGCLIDDTEYKTSMEGGTWERVVGTTLRTHTDLIMNLQYIHDNFDPSFWNDTLTSLARRKELVMPTVDI